MTWGLAVVVAYFIGGTVNAGFKRGGFTTASSWSVGFACSLIVGALWWLL